MLGQANGLEELAHDPDDDWRGMAVGERGEKEGNKTKGLKLQFLQETRLLLNALQQTLTSLTDPDTNMHGGE